jgi:methanogenic corrinoid protein MtbC1
LTETFKETIVGMIESIENITQENIKESLMSISGYYQNLLDIKQTLIDNDWVSFGVPFDMLSEDGFPPHIVDALRCVTKIGDDEPYEEFIQRVKSNPLAVAVKINDLTDNMDIRRLPDLTDKDVQRLRKYLQAYRELCAIGAV